MKNLIFGQKIAKKRAFLGKKSILVKKTRDDKNGTWFDKRIEVFYIK